MTTGKELHGKPYAGKWRAAVSAAALVAIPFAANADGYQYIVSGYPAANVSYPAVSSGTSRVVSVSVRETAVSSSASALFVLRG